MRKERDEDELDGINSAFSCCSKKYLLDDEAGEFKRTSWMVRNELFERKGSKTKRWVAETTNRKVFAGRRIAVRGIGNGSTDSTDFCCFAGTIAQTRGIVTHGTK